MDPSSLGRVETTWCGTGARVHMISPHVRVQHCRPELELCTLQLKGADGHGLRALVSIKVVARHARICQAQSSGLHFRGGRTGKLLSAFVDRHDEYVHPQRSQKDV